MGSEQSSAPSAARLSLPELSEELLVAFKTGDDPAPYLAALAALDDSDLAVIRDDRGTALAFWCNLYNAGTQHLLETRVALYESRLRAVRFFRAPALTVAGHSLSLDDIEHGLLRGRSKYGLGYLPRVFPDTFEKRHRVEEVDPRIHFALNCGAESCPAIRAYTPEAIDEQLDLATETYLDATVEYDSAANTLRIPMLFRWYRGDFGGKSGIRDLLEAYDSLPADTDPTIAYTSWDWTQAAGKFAGG